MRPARNFLWVFPLLLPFLFLNTANVFASDDDYTPDVTARVARIGFLRGDAQIKRTGSRDWERAAQNLPIVEGDEITTATNSRLEIQFDSRNYLRLTENSYLKITTLKDEGIAVSLSQGSLSLRVLAFDKERSYFEVDAPKTTVAVQRAGMYRVDAGDSRKPEVRVTVTDDGEARLYSENSGFVLRNGRSARIYLEGSYAGEWETSDAARYADDFDNWALERDAMIAKRLQNAAYDKYYDRDVYGAEDLSEYGEWIYTKKYGYVWRPFPNAVSDYANWSPYRYGHWRWVPPYGWTWVNDEPWGWATYHHGRWVYVDNGWVWTPYSQHRASRNWWHPALVVVTYSGSLICWYPLPYENNYYNYNSTYIDRRRTTIINNTTVIVNPTPAPTPIISKKIPREKNPRFERKPLEYDVPPSGVVAVDASDFGRRTKGFMTAPPELAGKVLSRTPLETEKPLILPTYTDLNGNVSKEILVDNPRVGKINRQIQTGASQRNEGTSLDENLRNERIYGNRLPVERTPPSAAKEDGENPETPKTGAVKRLRHSGIVRGGSDSGDNSETREKSQEGNVEQPAYKPRNKNREREQMPPSIYVPPSQPEEQQEERKERKEHRRNPPEQSPPVQEEQEQRREEHRQKPPEREQPPPPRSEQPPTRVEPRPEPPPRIEPKPEPREEKPPPQPERKIEPSPPKIERQKQEDKDG